MYHLFVCLNCKYIHKMTYMCVRMCAVCVLVCSSMIRTWLCLSYKINVTGEYKHSLDSLAFTYVHIHIHYAQQLLIPLVSAVFRLSICLAPLPCLFIACLREKVAKKEVKVLVCTLFHGIGKRTYVHIL